MSFKSIRTPPDVSIGHNLDALPKRLHCESDGISFPKYLAFWTLKQFGWEIQWFCYFSLTFFMFEEFTNPSLPALWRIFKCNLFYTFLAEFHPKGKAAFFVCTRCGHIFVGRSELEVCNHPFLPMQSHKTTGPFIRHSMTCMHSRKWAVKTQGFASCFPY